MIKNLTGRAHWLRATFVVTALLSGCGQPLGVHHARTPPLNVTHGMVIAQNEPFARRGSLNLLCGGDGSLRLFLHARLPYPGERGGSGISSQEGVFFVGGIEKEIRLTFTVSSGEVDESVSDRLTRARSRYLNRLERACTAAGNCFRRPPFPEYGTSAHPDLGSPRSDRRRGRRCRDLRRRVRRGKRAGARSNDRLAPAYRLLPAA